jgi:DNA polymerase elongation subunit (family B)
MDSFVINRDLKWAGVKSGETLSKERIQELINLLELEKTKQNNTNSSLKICLNSIYGVIGFRSFLLYNVDCAEAVTLMSQSLLKYTIQCFDSYFKQIFPTNKELHTKLGITYNCVITYNVTNYADTDSVMPVLGRIYKECEASYKENYKPDEHIVKLYNLDTNNPNHRKIEFFLRLHEYGLKGFIDTMMVKFVDRYHGFHKHPSGRKALKLGLEQINYGILWTAKKKYAKNVAWDSGKIYDPLKKISFKGLEMNQNSVPEWVRKKLTEMVTWLLSFNQKDLDYEELARKVKSIKEEFDNIQELEQICKQLKVSNYNKFMVDDTTEVKFQKGTPFHVKAAINYNYMLYKSKYKSKYETIKSGQKVHVYKTIDKELEHFAFINGFFPVEFAPKIDMGAQFKVVFLEPLNNIIEKLGFTRFNVDLITIQALW